MISVDLAGDIAIGIGSGYWLGRVMFGTGNAASWAIMLAFGSLPIMIQVL